MTKRYQYNILCKECLKEGIEEKTYVGHWSYEKTPEGVKTTSHCHCDRGHRWKETSLNKKEELPVLPVKIVEDVFISKTNVMKTF